MKRVLLLICLSLTLQPVFAKNVKVEALSSFSTTNPPKTWKVKVIEDFVTKNGFSVNHGSIIEGRIDNVTDPKRLKRNASFVFTPIYYYDVKSQINYQIKQDFAGKYSSLSDLDAKTIAKNGAIFVGNQVLDGFFGPGIAVTEGLIKNEQGNRAKSVAVSVYEKTPLSYASKGKEIEIKAGQQFVMSFKHLNEDKPNYSYKVE
ncbi:MAG: hypothetical protein E7Z89_03710 [Cyanobacteria bacterium SIG28]|nr:hypothetical protein [Cyanobacteria bacterium SIG28]